MALLTLYFIRHGESTGNLIRQLQSVFDTELTPRGYQQAQDLRGDVEVEVVYHSPLRRAAETARVIFEGEADLVEMQDLREIDIGRLAGKVYPELSKEEKEIVRRIDNNRDFAIEGGESLNQLRERILNVLEDIIQDMKTREVDSCAVVTHGGFLKEFLKIYLEQSQIVLGNCSIHLVKFDTTRSEWSYIEADDKDS